ncbi:hypothetical protein BBP40_010487 [Aspergillus hancockii]|nr:hypothetical protein BBP40_010487 [Aspergillus hancockii]
MTTACRRKLPGQRSSCTKSFGLKGGSFTVKGHLILGLKWRFRVGFKGRKGMALHDVSFDGKSAFYRLSLSEMFIPYGDPRNPIYRKGTFDQGNVGAGITANNLQSKCRAVYSVIPFSEADATRMALVGCDCLAMIKYLDGCVVAQDGSPAPNPNIICIHKIDNKIQWKHTNQRTGKTVVVRKRQLVLQIITAVANYDYTFVWYFDQSGELTFETRATGILSTQLINKEAKVPWKSHVADGEMAPCHQHLSNLRIDPAVGRHRNSFASTDSVTMPWDENIKSLGTGYVTGESMVDRAGPVSLGGTGIKSRIEKSRDMVRNEDTVVWNTFGFPHNPCLEDFPFMPAEIAQV